MSNKKQIIDPEKIYQTFGIKYKKSFFYTAIGEKTKKAFHFPLEEKGKKRSMDLFYNPDLSTQISLRIETENGYQSSIDFSNITKVTYIPKYKKIIFESHTETHFSVLAIYWRGQFDLHSGWEEKDYSETTWAKKKSKNPFK